MMDSQENALKQLRQQTHLSGETEKYTSPLPSVRIHSVSAKLGMNGAAAQTR